MPPRLPLHLPYPLAKRWLLLRLKNLIEYFYLITQFTVDNEALSTANLSTRLTGQVLNLINTTVYL
jgi:hypothetical protein